MQNGNPVTIATFRDVREAELARAVLAGSGIDAHIGQPFTASIAPHHFLGMSGVQLLVAAEDVDRAAEVLDASDAEGEPLDEEQ